MLHPFCDSSGGGPAHPLHGQGVLCWRRRWLALACLPWPVQGRPRSPAVPLAQPLSLATDLDPSAYLVSEKLDGVRAIWDGQQLRFRSGLPIAAPAAFLQRLPPVALDGELWMGRGRFEALSGCVRRVQPDEAEWAGVRYMVFELPEHPGPFEHRAQALAQHCRASAWSRLQAVTQDRITTRAALRVRLEQVLAAGGEGLILHRADAPYVTGRTDALLKLKPLDDAEATVIAHVSGQGRHVGRLGALKVRRDDGAVFHIGTGFSDRQREAPPPVGARVTYTHRGLTVHGLPRFPSFLRVRDEP